MWLATCLSTCGCFPFLHSVSDFILAWLYFLPGIKQHAWLRKLGSKTFLLFWGNSNGMAVVKKNRKISPTAEEQPWLIFFSWADRHNTHDKGNIICCCVLVHQGVPHLILATTLLSKSSSLKSDQSGIITDQEVKPDTSTQDGTDLHFPRQKIWVFPW